MKKPSRNDPCPCGSGKKYKRCCLAEQATPVRNLTWQRMRRTEGELIRVLLKHAHKYYGPEAVAEAWDEFSLWDEVPMDPESEPELDTAFLPWFVFNWIPDNNEVDEAEHYPEMQIAMHYLEQQGASVDSFQRRFIKEVCSQSYSFFAVTAVVPGKQMTIRDLILDRKVTVIEQQASTTLSKGSILYSRVMTMDGVSIMVGCAPIAIPPVYENDFIEIRENISEVFPDYDHEFLSEYDIELRSIYYDIREELHGPVIPQLRNMDGDELQFTTLHYSLQCSPHKALDALAGLSMAGAGELLDEGESDSSGESVSIKFPWLREGNARHKSRDNTVLGYITIDRDQLIVEVNSQERADTIKREITRRLGERATFRTAMIQSAEKLLEDIQTNPPDMRGITEPTDEDLMEMPEVREKIRQLSERHWQDWLDTPIPALRDQTPRQAAESEQGRERLEALLLQFEQLGVEKQPFRPDVVALRRSLGLE